MHQTHDNSAALAVHEAQRDWVRLETALCVPHTYEPCEGVFLQKTHLQHQLLASNMMHEKFHCVRVLCQHQADGGHWYVYKRTQHLLYVVQQTPCVDC